MNMKNTDGNEVRKLTNAELELMRIIWDKKKAFLGDIVESYPEESRPAYPTISTVVRILEKKGFISHDSFGKVNRYFPMVTKERYRKMVLKRTLSTFFNDSPREMLSCFADKGSLSSRQYDELIECVKELLSDNTENK
jgi:BlaI family transcriptional regulator, penicillinase repressor